MTTLVVGGAGLLGSAVCDRLENAIGVSRRTGFDFCAEEPPSDCAGRTLTASC